MKRIEFDVFVVDYEENSQGSKQSVKDPCETGKDYTVGAKDQEEKSKT